MLFGTVSDQQLDDVFAAAQQGEAWALRSLYDETAPRVFAYLKGRGAAEPEDLTSEVFLTVFPKLPSVTNGLSGFRTFAFSVAHARLVDDLRKRSRRDPEHTYDPATDPRTTTSAEHDALLNASTDRVRRLIDTLQGDQRDVLALRILGDLTLEQVANALGKSPGAVKQLQRRGLIALRRHLEAET